MDSAVMERPTREAEYVGFDDEESPIGDSAQEKFANLRREMRASLVEREAEIDILLLALVSGEHAVFCGPPGTAKSLLCNSLAAGIGGARRFAVLLTKFSTPEEVFGPLNIAGLKEGKYERITDAMLPDAEFAFLDEVFKASSAILNSCLTAMEERRFKNNGQWRQMPLMTLVGASNEWPVGEGYQELGALFDRFLFRAAVKPVSPAGHERLLFGSLPPVNSQLAISDIVQARQEAALIPVPNDTKDAYYTILAELQGNGIKPGDRRCRKAVGAARASAWLSGHNEVRPIDLECLKDVLWEDPREQPLKAAEIICKVANPSGAEIQGILVGAEEIMSAPYMAAFMGNGVMSNEAMGGIRKLRDTVETLRKLRAGSSCPERVDEAVAYLKGRMQPMLMKATNI